MEDKIYRANIKMVGTVLPDTKLILKKYLEVKDIEVLKKEVLENNLVLKSSKRRSESIYYEVRKRYLKDQLDGFNESSFICFCQNFSNDLYLNLLLYYHLCKEEKIIYDYITCVVFERYKEGFLGVSLADSEEYILGLSKIDKNILTWSERTVKDVRSALMGILKDFGFINSTKRAVFNEMFIPSIVFYYVIYECRNNLKSIEDVYDLEDLKLFLLLKSDIDILLQEAYRNGVLDFNEEEGIKQVIFKFKNVKEIIKGYVDGEIQ